MFSKIRNLFLTLRNSKVSSKCGHITRVRGRVKYYPPIYEGVEESNIAITLKLDENATADQCIYCIQESSVRCAWCGGTILPGEPVTLYTSKQHNVMPSKEALVDENESGDLSYVGCSRCNCATSNADIAGFLGNYKSIIRDKSPYQQVFETGKPVVINFWKIKIITSNSDYFFII